MAVGFVLPGRPRGVPLGGRLRPRLLHVLRGRRPRRPPRRARLAARLRPLGRRRARGRARDPPRPAPDAAGPPHQCAALLGPPLSGPDACAAERCAPRGAGWPDARVLRQCTRGRRRAAAAVGRRAAVAEPAALAAGERRCGSHPRHGRRSSRTGREDARVRHAVIMAGGSGTRLWPLSRAERPKQLLDVVADDGGALILLREAFDRLRSVLPAEQIWVCTAARYGDAVRAALPELSADRLILEPV